MTTPFVLVIAGLVQVRFAQRDFLIRPNRYQRSSGIALRVTRAGVLIPAIQHVPNGITNRAIVIVIKSVFADATSSRPVFARERWEHDKYCVRVPQHARRVRHGRVPPWDFRRAGK